MTQDLCGMDAGVSIYGEGGDDEITINDSGGHSATFASGGHEKDKFYLNALPSSAFLQFEGDEHNDVFNLGHLLNKLSDLLGIIAIIGGMKIRCPTIQLP